MSALLASGLVACARPALLGLQATAITQRIAPFAAAYSGSNSLTPRGVTSTSQSYGVYAGSRVGQVELYVDAELLRGHVPGGGRGLGGVPNGDAVAPDPDRPLDRPFIARAFARYALPLSPAREVVDRGIDQLPGSQPADRIELKVGRMASSDDFDPNRYAGNARTQFMNWALFSNTAWDYAADARGYATGGNVAIVHPRWSVRVGRYLMPVDGAGAWTELHRSHGDDAQITFAPGSHRTVVRVFAFRNAGRMSDYRDALDVARRMAGPAPAVPMLDAVAHYGQINYGGGVNVEQPLSEHGNFGILVRAGCNDGHSNGFATSEVDRHASIGTQYRLKRVPHRSQDYVGLGVARHWLSADHRDYLAAGGRGFFLGDGALRYAPETIVEGYYRAQLGPWMQVGPDVQLIRSPGYNADRGPVVALALRVHAQY